MALSALRDDNTIIKPADKGGAIAVMDYNMYQKGILEMLSDTILGTSMGSAIAPAFANLLVGFLEERYIYTSPLFTDNVMVWGRYIDDVIMNAWSRGAPSFSPSLHYTGQAFKRRNVVRFKNKGAKEDLPDRRHVIRELLCNQMGFTPADILAVINLPDRQGYDISFKLMASLDRFWASVTKFRGAEGWDQFILIPVSKPGTVSVNILFWNESVPPQDIVIWLRRHCDMVTDLTKCLDDDGIWTGGWRVLVKLRQHSNVTLHLPNSFFIGRERGVCFYAGQPRLCFKCGKAGHVAGVCTVVKCNLCGEIGHTSAMCTNVRCNLCGLEARGKIDDLKSQLQQHQYNRYKSLIVERDYGAQGTPDPFESCRDKVAKKLVMALRDTQGNLQESQAGSYMFAGT
ncbi:uncharacterized protein PAF06_017166 [Gastrophryne carolinensis]